MKQTHTANSPRKKSARYNHQKNSILKQNRELERKKGNEYELYPDRDLFFNQLRGGLLPPHQHHQQALYTHTHKVYSLERKLLSTHLPLGPSNARNKNIGENFSYANQATKEALLHFYCFASDVISYSYWLFHPVHTYL
jgi:hypothetical protein